MRRGVNENSTNDQLRRTLSRLTTADHQPFALPLAALKVVSSHFEIMHSGLSAGCSALKQELQVTPSRTSQALWGISTSDPRRDTPRSPFCSFSGPTRLCSALILQSLVGSSRVGGRRSLSPLGNESSWTQSGRVVLKCLVNGRGSGW